MPTKNQPSDNATQSAAFVAKARELEADGDESRADLLMGRLANMKPEPRAERGKLAPSKAKSKGSTDTAR